VLLGLTKEGEKELWLALTSIEKECKEMTMPPLTVTLDIDQANFMQTI
jgi:hypothetical protein